MIVAEAIERTTSLDKHLFIVMSEEGTLYAIARFNEKELRYELKPANDYKNFLLAIKAMVVKQIFVGSYVIILEV